MRDKYLSGVCDEIIRGENKKCKEDDDCAMIYFNVLIKNVLVERDETCFTK